MSPFVAWRLREFVEKVVEKVLVPIEEYLELFVIVALCLFVGAIYVGALFFSVVIPVIALAIPILIGMTLWRGFKRSPWIALGLLIAFAFLAYLFYDHDWNGVLSVLIVVAGVILWVWAPYYHKPTPPLDPTSFSQGM